MDVAADEEDAAAEAAAEDVTVEVVHPRGDHLKVGPHRVAGRPRTGAGATEPPHRVPSDASGRQGTPWVHRGTPRHGDQRGGIFGRALTWRGEDENWSIGS